MAGVWAARFSLRAYYPGGWGSEATSPQGWVGQDDQEPMLQQEVGSSAAGLKEECFELCFVMMLVIVEQCIGIETGQSIKINLVALANLPGLA